GDFRMGLYHEQARYQATIAAAALGQAKNEKKTPQLELTLDINGMYGEDGQVYECRKGRVPPSVYLSITEATMGTDAQPGWVAEVLGVLNFNGDFNDTDQFVGMVVDVYCAHGQNQKGDPREQWSIERKRDPRQGVNMEKKQVRTLNSRFGK